ncbi:MAG: tryptophan-rich sensory protein [Alphaproteobacteria bacterium]|nr:tryptophan-rich sensory protein [Alphaproteobacteria bacterium]
MRTADVQQVAVFLLLVVGVGLAIGYATVPGAWYANLAKPSFTPPGWLFAPVWTVLYICIAIAGWRIWAAAPRSIAMLLWSVALILNFLWSPAFFGAHLIGAALLVVGSLFVAVVLFIPTAWPHSRTAAVLFVPYAAWVAFAASLNGAIYVLN